MSALVNPWSQVPRRFFASACSLSSFSSRRDRGVYGDVWDRAMWWSGDRRFALAILNGSGMSYES